MGIPTSHLYPEFRSVGSVSRGKPAAHVLLYDGLRHEQTNPGSLLLTLGGKVGIKPLMVAAPEVCDLADTAVNVTRNAVNAIAAKIRWGHKCCTFIMGSPSKVECLQLNVRKGRSAMPQPDGGAADRANAPGLFRTPGRDPVVCNLWLLSPGQARSGRPLLRYSSLEIALALHKRIAAVSESIS